MSIRLVKQLFTRGRTLTADALLAELIGLDISLEIPG
jgi:hypothetical protein